MINTGVSTLLAFEIKDDFAEPTRMCLRRAKRVLAHTSLLHIPVITTLVLPGTAPAGQALDNNEVMVLDTLANNK